MQEKQTDSSESEQDTSQVMSEDSADEKVKKKASRVSKTGKITHSLAWTIEEEKRLVKEVAKLGGKVPGWYSTLAKKKIFGNRSALSINSQYNNLLRKMSPLIDDEVLKEEKLRRESSAPRKRKKTAEEEAEPEEASVKEEVKTPMKASKKTLPRSPKSPKSLKSPKKGKPKPPPRKPITQRKRYKELYWARIRGLNGWPCVAVPPEVALKVGRVSVFKGSSSSLCFIIPCRIKE